MSLNGEVTNETESFLPLLSKASFADYFKKAVLVVVFLAFAAATLHTILTVSKLDSKQLKEPLKPATKAIHQIRAPKEIVNEENTFAVDADYEKIC